MTIEEILRLAKEMDASDIHIAPGSPLMFRINGQLLPLNEELMKTVDVEKLMKTVMSKEQFLELGEKGEADLAVSILGFSRIRVNVFRQCGTYAMSLRILSYEVPSPDVLRIPSSFVELTNCKKGLILVTGMAGSGKSTTLASLIDVIAQRDCKNIITIESPIEYLHPHKKSIVSQREVGVDVDDYARGVRTAIRQDPDVIMIGELQDVDTISVALKAAEAGHLVLSALHTNSAVDAITRIIEMFPSYQQQQIRVQLSSVLKGVMAQQLLPRTDVCGRTAVYEVLLANQTIKDMIRENKNQQIQGIIQKSRKEGMQSMDDAILEAYMRSEIAMDHAISYAQNPENMAQKVRIF